MPDISNKNYGTPCISLNNNLEFHSLEPIDLNKDSSFEYNEDWLQNIIFDNVNLLPVDQVDPIFGNLIPVCREIQTPVGPLDNLFINELGMLTLVECKLWRNPEARRKVVGQILDYAQEFSRWTYEDLLVTVQKALKSNSNILYDLILQKNNAIKEHEFIDNVTRNLRKGRFLLLIVGDGIRENVENISAFLQEHAQLNFTFALVEQRVFKLPSSLGQGIVVQPQVLARSIEIERAVIRIEGSNILVNSPTTEKATSKNAGKRRGNITEQVFYESLEKSSQDLPKDLQGFFEITQNIGLIIEAGASGLMLKTEDRGFNFALFHYNGYIQNFGCGNSELGKEYLENLSMLIEDSTVVHFTNGFDSTVKKNNGDYISISEALQKRDDWVKLITSVLTKLSE